VGYTLLQILENSRLNVAAEKKAIFHIFFAVSSHSVSKEILNSDGQQFHQCKRNEKSLKKKMWRG
jgi:hypothetical protein